MRQGHKKSPQFTTSAHFPPSNGTSRAKQYRRGEEVRAFLLPEKKSDGLGDRLNCIFNNTYFVIDFVNSAIRKHQQNTEGEREDHQVTF